MIPIKVLFIDDEVIIKRIIMEKVNWDKYNMEITKIANNACEALEYLDKFHVDLIITDIKMPLIDGNEFIKKALSLKKNFKFLVLSAYTDFDIVRKSFKLGVYDYMQKSDINTPVMDNILVKLRNEITNENTKNADGMDEALSEGFTDGFADTSQISVSKRYTVLLIKYLDFHSKTGKQVIKLVKEANEVQKLFFTDIFKDRFTVIIEHISKSYKNINHERERITEIIKKSINREKLISYYIGVSTTGFGSEIDTLKFEAEEVIESQYYHIQSKKVFYYEPKANKQELLEDDWKLRLKREVEMLNIDKASDILKELMTRIHVIKPDKTRCQDFIYNIYVFYVNYLYNNNIIAKVIELDYNRIHNIIKQFDKFDKLEEWITNNLEIIHEGYMLKYRSNLAEILKVYIKFNLNEDLSVNKIAEKYNVNSSYISYLFKKQEGTSLKKYINEVKINKAKHYLVNTNIKVKEICNLLGYNNPEHFSRVFKERFGESPNFYRGKSTI